jgi:guanosine-3',5'-bis(diphosphate) 3'-pyrophosphohydrolase
MEQLSVDQILQKVRDFADQAHGEQMRKYSDDRYIVHPVRVMETTRLYLPNIAVQAAALLHDVLEDTPVTQQEILAFLETIMDKTHAAQTVKLVEELTDVFIKKDFPRLKRKERKRREAERLEAASAEAQTIKYADIFDNADVTYNDENFAPVFLKEARMFIEKMSKGHPVLREIVRARIEECLAHLEAKRIYQ